ncbi:gephyrin-like molybdotransferase Glp [Pseudoalteromonas sp. SSM20]|uniref:molybdopterin molybdotransferase MoeA n=1 Tax=Pseudoalteromonas sp. SSM20 TaxID=3139394 RepID=UPI003BA8508F
MSCDCDSYQQHLLPFTTAYANLIAHAQCSLASETIPLLQATGRILSQAVISPVNVPPHNNSAMDGYAFKFNDLAEHQNLTLVGTALAGHPYSNRINHGECIRIMTGAPIPSSVDTVVMQEMTCATDNVISIKDAHKLKLGANVRQCAEDIALGQTILNQGHTLKAADIGLLASLGIHQITVYQKITVAVLSTGDELVSPGDTLSPGQIYESNRHTLIAYLQQLPVNIVDLGIIKDSKEAIREAFWHADEVADVVISSGGVSVGEADFIKDILNELGEINFWKLAIKPGKPFAYGQLANSHFIGLPGNPVSATVTFEQLALPFIQTLMGTQAKSQTKLLATATSDFKKRPGRFEFQRAIATEQDGKWQVVSVGAQGSGILSSMSRANCYVLLEENSNGAAIGDTVTIALF